MIVSKEITMSRDGFRNILISELWGRVHLYVQPHMFFLAVSKRPPLIFFCIPGRV
jgi:hypothetical protein